jgi:RNA polymerase sigma factor (sigma-70 family)
MSPPAFFPRRVQQLGAKSTVRIMESHPQGDRSAVEARFAQVFAHLGFITSYARHRGARDADGIAGEAMAIAWRRLADIPVDDSRPWLINTARNLLLSERRREPAPGSQWLDDLEVEAPAEPLAPELDLAPELAEGLRALSEEYREALLLIAWDDLTPVQAAASLGISRTAFRSRLHRARRQLRKEMATHPATRQVPPQQPNWRQT